MKNLDSLQDNLVNAHRTRKPSGSELQVSAVLDEFSAQCFEGVLNLWRPTPLWAVHDQKFIQPDFLLVESAWSGNFATWRYMVTSEEGPAAKLRELVAECKSLGIPTVFWNKEDPVHFDEFSRTAREFDYVLTTEEDLVTKYKAMPGVRDAALLRFAADPALHNPRRVDDYRAGDIAFAGMYFTHKYENRRKQMDQLFPAASNYDFSIYSRMYGGDPRYQFPDRYTPFIVGSLPYEEMVKAYRKHKVFLNVNSVPQSRTMCARRVFELSAAKTAVVGMESEAIRSVYDEKEVLLAKDPGQVREIFDYLITDDLGRRVTVQKAWRKTLGSHTYENRVDEIASLLDMPRSRQKIKLHVLLLVEGQELDSLCDDIARQEFPYGEPPEVTFSVPADLDRNLSIPGMQQVKATPLDAEYVCVMNSNFRYGRYYLNDLLLTIRQQDSDMAAKLISNSVEDWADHEEALVNSVLPSHGFIYKNGDRARSDIDNGSGEIYFGDGFGVTSKNRSDDIILDN